MINNKGLKLIGKTIVIIIIQIIIVTIFSVGVIFYGPFKNIEEIIVTSAMTSMTHQYIVELFLSDKEIENIMKKNAISTPKNNSNEAAITVVKNYAKKENNNLDTSPKYSDKVELLNVSNGEFKAYMLLVSDPRRVSVAYSKNIGTEGMKLEEMVKSYNAIGGVNAGGFEDVNGKGNGGIPQGLLISDSKVVFGKEGQTLEVIGFNKDSALFLGNYNLQQLREKKVKDAVTFGPFIIVDGQPMITKGNGGWGLAPRTAIGQKQDGTILLLVIDGRQVGSIGATLKEVQDIMLKYGAYNAANLDGGASTTMVYNNKIINKPCSIYGPRYLPSAFIIK